MATALMGTASAANAIARVKYTHDAMVDLILAEPALSQNELAGRFGYTVAWVSRIINSDSFQHRLAMRKTEIVDPTLVLSLEERLKGLASLSLDVMHEKLAATRSTELATKAAEIATKALGFGARQTNVQVNNTQNSYVVALPPKIVDAAEWAQTHGRTIPATVAQES